MGLSFGDWVAVASAALALASVVMNWMIVSRQTELQYETLRAEMDAEVIAWANEAIDFVSQAAALARNHGRLTKDEFLKAASEVEFRLSSVADRGRLFFPNEYPDAVGKEKEGAFQGIRPPILDALVFACCQVEQLKRGESANDEAAEFLVKCRRLLVSEAQNAIDPRRKTAMLSRLATGRKDDAKSNLDVAYELGASLDARYPRLPLIQTFMNAQRHFRGKR
jgi:hypothetical protein